MGDSAREYYYDEQERARMTPLERAVYEVERQERTVRWEKERLKDAVRKLHAKRADVARLRREGSR